MPRESFPKRNYLCPLCQKAFTTSGHLLRHSKVHTGEKKHRCPFPGCQTSCSRQDNLQQHYRIHLSSGSRRSAPAPLAKSSPPPTEANDSSPLSLMSMEDVTPVPLTLPEVIPYTSVDGPPVLQFQVRGHQFVHDPSYLPSPPNTPPPLIPANPRIVLHRRQQALARRHSTGTLLHDAESNGLEINLWLNDDSPTPLRPLSSSSCSSSATSSPTPSFEPFGYTISSNESGSSSSSPHPVTTDISHSFWMAEDRTDPQQRIILIENESFAPMPLMVYDDQLSKTPSCQNSYEMSLTGTADYFGYSNLPGDAGPNFPTGYSQTASGFSQTGMAQFQPHSNVSNFSVSSIGAYNADPDRIGTFKTDDEQQQILLDNNNQQQQMISQFCDPNQVYAYPSSSYSNSYISTPSHSPPDASAMNYLAYHTPQSSPLTLWERT